MQESIKHDIRTLIAKGEKPYYEILDKLIEEVRNPTPNTPMWEDKDTVKYAAYIFMFECIVSELRMAYEDTRDAYFKAIHEVNVDDEIHNKMRTILGL